MTRSVNATSGDHSSVPMDSPLPNLSPNLLLGSDRSRRSSFSWRRFLGLAACLAGWLFLTDARAAKAWQRDDLGTLTELAGEEVKRTPLRLKQWVESENGSPRWVLESRELDELVRDEHTPWVWNGAHPSPAPRGMWIGL
ncbi:MAG: hypothetical protein R3B96_25035, partial [Pirellulaceae bacterium]